METQYTNHTLQEKALKLKKQRRRQILASLLGIAILAWGIVEVACLFLDYKHAETSNDAQIEQYNSPVNLSFPDTCPLVKTVEYRYTKCNPQSGRRIPVIGRSGMEPVISFVCVSRKHPTACKVQ